MSYVDKNKEWFEQRIAPSMRMWREGLIPMPTAYVRYHEAVAQDEICQLAADHGLTIHRTYMEDQGWMDGFRCLHAIVETRGGTLLKLQWHDSGHTGYFMQKLSAGWGKFDPREHA